MSSQRADQDNTIVDVLKGAIADLIAVYRFGSTAHGTAVPSSDADVGVLAAGRIPDAIRFDLQERIAAGIRRDVDLVDLAVASPVMAIQVVARGEVLFDGDPEARGRFEDRVFGTYARLNEERRGILERVAAEGTVYGR